MAGNPFSRLFARPFLARCLLAIGSLALALILVEVACRVFLPANPTIRFQQDVDELENLDLDEAAGMIQNDPELFWRLTPGTTLPEESWPFFGLIANEQSLREDKEIPVEKPGTQLRILFLGDSCTFGYGVDHRQSFVDVSESLLEEQLGRPVECINAGVPGYSLFQGYRYLVTEGLRFEPDLVVLNFGWNDSGIWDHMGDREHHEAMRKMTPPGLLSSSRLCQITWQSLNRPDTDGTGREKRPRMLPDEFTETLGQVHTLLQERGIPLLVLVWPMRANFDPELPPGARTPYQVRMMDFGKKYPMSDDPPVGGALDLVPVGASLVGKYGIQATYLDHGHVTPRAHRVFAETIVKHIEPWLKSP